MNLRFLKSLLMFSIEKVPSTCPPPQRHQIHTSVCVYWDDEQCRSHFFHHFTIVCSHVADHRMDDLNDLTQMLRSIVAALIFDRKHFKSEHC